MTLTTSPTLVFKDKAPIGEISCLRTELNLALKSLNPSKSVSLCPEIPRIDPNGSDIAQKSLDYIFKNSVVVYDSTRERALLEEEQRK
jgi:hypothetical protein